MAWLWPAQTQSPSTHVTEDKYKIYAESFRGEEHLRQVQQEAQALVSEVLGN